MARSVLCGPSRVETGYANGWVRSRHAGRDTWQFVKDGTTSATRQPPYRPAARVARQTEACAPGVHPRGRKTRPSASGSVRSACMPVRVSRRPWPRPPGESPGVCRRGRRDREASADGSAGACRRKATRSRRRERPVAERDGCRQGQGAMRPVHDFSFATPEPSAAPRPAQAAARQLTQPVAVTPRDIPTTVHLRQQRKKPPKLTGSVEPFGRHVSRITLT